MSLQKTLSLTEVNPSSQGQQVAQIDFPGLADISVSKNSSNRTILWVHAQSCLTLGDLMNCSLSASATRGIFPARILE